MAIIKCPECGHEISDKAPFCPSCGVAIAGRTITCPECGQTYFSELKECPKCHHLTQQHPQAETTATPDNPNENKVHAKRNNKTILIISLAIVAVIGALCWWMMKSSESDKENAAYEYAMTSDNAQVLQDYLANYTDAPEEHRDSIEAHLAILQQADQEWTNAVISGSKAALQQYIDAHPDSPFKAIALHKIDSIDWASACEANTVEAMESYLDMHQDGDYVEEASNKLKVLNTMTVQPEEKIMLSSLFSSFFHSINTKDEDALTSTVNPLLTSFLGKTDATRSDVVTFMHKLYKSDVTSMMWQPSGNYSIDKKEIGDQQYEYSITFTATQSVQHADSKTTTSNFRISAKVNPDGRITELNMVKVAD